MNDIVFINLTTTGLDVLKDRIIEISMSKFDADLNYISSYSAEFNSEGVQLSEYTCNLVGKHTEYYDDKPLFADKMNEIIDFIGNSDFGGYNIQFHINFLVQSFFRCGVNYEYRTHKIVDPYLIHKRQTSMAFENVYKLYTGKDAIFDTNEEKVKLIAKLYKTQKSNCMQMDEGDSDYYKTYIDAGSYFMKITNSDGSKDIVYNFGKHKGKSIFEVDINYLKWMVNSGVFPLDTVNVVNVLINFINKHPEKYKFNNN